MSSPARRPTRAAEGPAALTTRGRVDAPLARAHAAHAIVLAVDPGDVDALRDAHPQLARPPGEAVGDLRRSGHAVLRPPHGGDEVVDAQGRHQRLRVLGRDAAHVDAEAPLEGHPLLEAAQIVLVGHEEQVADLPVADVDAELLPEVLEHANGLQREADLRLGGELGADAARRLARGAGAHGLALDDDDVAQSAAGEVIGDAAADDSAADDHRACRAGNAHGLIGLLGAPVARCLGL